MARTHEESRLREPANGATQVGAIDREDLKIFSFQAPNPTGDVTGGTVPERGYVSLRRRDPRSARDGRLGNVAGARGHARGRRRNRGNRRWRDRALERRVERYVGTPVDVAQLEVGLRALQEEPLVERVNAQLLPRTQLGESQLRLAITERPAFKLLVDAANDRSPTVGERRGTLGLTYRGLVGNGDTLSGQFGSPRASTTTRCLITCP